MLWTHLVDLLRATIFAVAHVCNGSLGLAVFLVTLGLRLLLLPLSLRLARRAHDQQRRLAALKPQLDRINARYAADPGAQWRATRALHARHGIRAFDPAGLAGAALQLPVIGGVFGAVRGGFGAGARFLWIRDLARPNLPLVLLVTVVSMAAVGLGPSATPAQRIAVLPLLVTGGATIWFLASTSAAVAIASGASLVVSLVQSLLLRRAVRPAGSAA
jgi:YidC/Oxa1 family membrane protein insertase